MNDPATEETEGMGEPAGTEDPGNETRSGWRTAAYIAAAVAVVAILFLLGRQLGGYKETFEQWIQSLGIWAPIVFIVLYAVGTVAFAPGSVFTLISGAIFGLLWGTVYAWIGATIGASIAFLVARYLARGWVEKKIEGKPRFQKLDHSIGRDGGKIVALLRLAPIFPFVLLNYALGLTRVRFVHYVWACFAMIPGTLLYVYYGHLAGQALEGAQDPWKWVLNGIGLVAVVWVTVIITRKAKHALAAETELEEDDVEGSDA